METNVIKYSSELNDSPPRNYKNKFKIHTDYGLFPTSSQHRKKATVETSQHLIYNYVTLVTY